MKLITAVLSLLIAILTISFTVSNRQSVTVSLWPTPFEITLPLAALIIIIAAVAFLLGWLFSWFRNVSNKIKLKKENKNLQKQVETYEQQIRDLKDKINKEKTETTTKSVKSIFFK